MKLLDILAKLGILRYGAKAATYKSGAERPIEFISDDVFDAKRDLTTREDLRNLTRAVKGIKPEPSAAAQPSVCSACGAELPMPARFCPRCGASVSEKQA